MENKVIEFFGLPGCGKTTLANEVAANTCYINIMSKYLNTLYGKAYMHLFWHVFKFNRQLNDVKKSILLLLDKEYYHIFNENVSIEQYINYILFNYYLGKYKKNIDIVFDEGLVHYCMALNAEFGVEFSKTDQILELLNISKRTVIGIKVDFKTIKTQIATRDRHVSLIDELSAENLDHVLANYLNAFDYYSGRFDSVNREQVLRRISMY